jgi:hypothetical protein
MDLGEILENRDDSAFLAVLSLEHRKADAERKSKSVPGPDLDLVRRRGVPVASAFSSSSTSALMCGITSLTSFPLISAPGRSPRILTAAGLHVVISPAAFVTIRPLETFVIMLSV